MGDRLERLTRREIGAIAEIRGITFNALVEDYDGVMGMYRNNLRRAHGRSDEKVLFDTVQGFGAELLLIRSGLFVAANPIVEDITKDLKIEQVYRDIISVESCRKVQVKTTQKTGVTYSYSEHVRNSIRGSLQYNDDILVMRAIPTEDPHTFTYSAFFIIDAEHTSRYMSHSKFGPFMAHRKAVENDHAVDLENY